MTYSVLTTSTLIVFILVVRKLAMNHIPQWLFPLFWWTVILRIMVRAQFVLSVPVEESEPIDVNGALIMERTAIKDQINSTELKVFLSIITGIILCVIFVKYFRQRSVLNSSLPCKDNAVRRWLEQNAILRNVGVYVSDETSQPLTYGVLRPKIVLPKSMDWKNKDELEIILSHEMMHIKRFDAITKTFLWVAASLQWYNPLTWIMLVIANRDIELACDYCVTARMDKSRKVLYAETLLRYADLKQMFVRVNSFSQYLIVERIESLVKAKLSIWISIMATIIILFIAFFAFVIIVRVPSIRYIFEGTGY